MKSNEKYYEEVFKQANVMNIFQKQSLAGVLQNRCSKKIRKFHRKTPVLESLFNKVVGLKAVI